MGGLETETDVEENIFFSNHHKNFALHSKSTELI